MLFGFAGLYDIWKDPKTEKEVKSYTIITTQPNELVGTVHGRMPVILQKEDEEVWLNPDTTEPEHLLPLLKPYPAEHMETWRVGDGAKNPRNDGEELIKPINYDSHSSMDKLEKLIKDTYNLHFALDLDKTELKEKAKQLYSNTQDVIKKRKAIMKRPTDHFMNEQIDCYLHSQN
jgi:FtsZ-binding cell division protein ZapB